MPKSVSDLEKEILALEQQKINIEIKIWNAKDNLLKARAAVVQASNAIINAVPAGSALQLQSQATSSMRNDHGQSQASTQIQENEDSRPTDLNSTPQPHNVSISASVNLGRVNHDMLLNNHRLATTSTQAQHASVDTNTVLSNNSVSSKELSPSSNLQKHFQTDAQCARIGMVPPTSRASPAFDVSRRQQAPLSTIGSSNSQQGAASSYREIPRMQQGPITVTAPHHGPVSINPFPHYRQLKAGVSSPQVGNLPSKQYPSFVPDDTPARAVRESPLLGSTATQTSPTPSRGALLYGPQSFDHQAQQTPTTNTFSFYAGLQPSDLNSTSHNDYMKSNADEPSPPTSRTSAGLGRGLTKKPREPASLSTPDGDSRSSVRSDSSLQRKRTPSIEITNQRPRQRLRSEDSRVMTPPLNDNMNIKPKYGAVAESDSFSGFKPVEGHHPVAIGDINEYNTAPPPTQPKRSDEEQKNSYTFGRPPQSYQSPKSLTPTQQAPPTAHMSDAHLTGDQHPDLYAREINESYSSAGEEDQNQHSPSSDKHQQQRTRRQPSGTPALLASHPPTNLKGPRPVRPRKPQGSYKTPEFKLLSAAERHDLETRFCCQVAKIIGSKICVNKPPVPYDNVGIFERLRVRLLGQGNSEDRHGDSGKCFLMLLVAVLRCIMSANMALQTNQRSTAPGPIFRMTHGGCYRTMSDWGSAKGVRLRLLVCSYPFLALDISSPKMQLTRKTGNARVMCYRMRLTSILDARMREIKQCIYECEIDFDASDWEGRRRRVDTWFGEEDFEEASHDAAR